MDQAEEAAEQVEVVVAAAAEAAGAVAGEPAPSNRQPLVNRKPHPLPLRQGHRGPAVVVGAAADFVEVDEDRVFLQASTQSKFQLPVKKLRQPSGYKKIPGYKSPRLIGRSGTIR